MSEHNKIVLFMSFMLLANVVSATTYASVANILNIHENGGQSFIAISPNGQFVYLHALSQAIVAVNTVTYAMQNLSAGKGCAELYIAPSGAELFVQCGSNESIVDVATGLTFNTPAPGAPGVAFSPSGNLAYLSSISESNVVVFNVVTNAIVRNITGFNKPYYIGINPNGTLLAVSNIGDNTVSLVNLQTVNIMKSIMVGSDPYRTEFTPSGKEIYISDHAEGNITVVDVASETMVNKINVGGALVRPVDIAFLQGYVYVSLHGTGNITIINISTNSIVQNLEINSLLLTEQNSSLIRDVVADSNGEYAYATGGTNLVTLKNLMYSKPPTTLSPLAQLLNPLIEWLNSYGFQIPLLS